MPDNYSARTKPVAELFPPGCTCLSYGHGITMTRVNSPACRVHGADLTIGKTDIELRAAVNAFTEDDPA